MRNLCSSVAAAFAALAAFAAHGYEIRLPDAAKPWEKTAAKELGDYLRRLASDGSVSVGDAGEATFHVGDTAFARGKGMGADAFADEEWAVRSFGRDVVLAGGGMRGTLYAVYHLLEDRCGVHWWHDDDEDVPEAKALALHALDMRGKPYFMYRDIWRTATNDLRTLVRNRLNGNCGKPIPAALGGGMVFGPPHLCHTWNRYLPFKKYGKEHPEWYSLRDGKRVGGQHHGQLCLSCPGLVEVFAAKVKESIAGAEAKARATGEPAPRFYDLTMNDNRRFCTCDACAAEVAKYGHSGQHIRFANRVAAIAGEGRPDLLFTVSSYSYASDLPSNGVHTASNVVLRTGPTRDYDSLGAPMSAYYRQKIRGWRGFADKLFIWDYSITYNLTEGMPFPSEYHYGEKYRFYAENGVKGVFWEHETPERQDMYELKFYLERALLEDPFQDCKALIDGFYRLYYRSAAPHVRAVRDRLRRIFDERNAFITYSSRLGDFAWIEPDDIDVMEGHFRAAESAAADDAKLLKRIARARQSIERLVAVRSRLRKCAPEVGFAGGREFYEFSADWLDLYDKDNVKLQKDPLAASGSAARIDVRPGKYNLPFDVACNWSKSGRKPLKCSYSTLQPGDGYAWYVLDVPDVPTNGYFFATSDWSIQCPLGFPELAGRHCEVYFSARFTGPKYRPGSKEPNRIYVDRVRVVPVDGCVVAACAAPSSRNYEIRLPNHAKPWEKTAAQELGDYLKKLASDGSVSVGGASEAVFHVGDTAFAREKGMGAGAFADEEWAVKSFGRDVVLSGGGMRGALYAVYHLLEDKCGVHWWHDGDEDVPEAKSLALPALDMRGRPYFLQRDIWRTATNDVRTLVRNRLNGNGGKPIPAAWGGGV
ncbi:MAG: DUF4838 domain-containing protein, partial [Kiritimatiellae bacterium]|nr:DUF4838 domain-containing protein [Kiritimatiellia bacterium]